MIEVLVIAAAQTHHLVKSVYMDYLVNVPPAGPPFQRLVARGVGASPARPGVFRKTLFYPRRLRTGRAPKPAKRGFFLLITTPWMSGYIYIYIYIFVYLFIYIYIYSTFWASVTTYVFVAVSTSLLV